MSCTQVNVCVSNVGVFLKQLDTRHASLSRSLSASSVFGSATINFQQYKAYPRLSYSGSKYRKCSPLHAYSGTGDSQRENEAFQWNPLKAIQGFKQESVERLLKKQLQEQKSNGGGNGRDPPRNGYGGDGSSGPKDEKSAVFMDELLQVIMATIGFVFVYLCITKGEEYLRLTRDYIRYRSGAKASARLIRAMDTWKSFCEIVSFKGARENLLERLRSPPASLDSGPFDP